MEKVYAQALLNLQSKGAKTSELVTQLSTHLKEKGRLKLLPRILAELKKMQARHEKEFTKLEVASDKETAKALKELDALGIDTNGVHVNHSLIKGYRILRKDVLVDRSAKRGLIDLYTNITNHH